MPIQLNYETARRRFDEALRLASSQAKLPNQWLDRTRKVGTAPNKTFTAMLGTALLAKATNAAVDPFALKVRENPNAYSARSLCKDVLVPLSFKADVYLGTTGREPLNNQPFFRHERVGPDMKVHPNARAHLDYLCETLGQAEALNAETSLFALAAFLRVRLHGAPKPIEIELAKTLLGVDDLVAVVKRFVTSNPEGGKRGQAFLAAAFDLVFHDVKTSRVNDPSRHWPGDVFVLLGRTISLTAEVKQRPVLDTEIGQFVGRVEEAGIARAVVATLDPSQPNLTIADLRVDAWQRHGVHLSILCDVPAVMHAALTWTGMPLQDALSSFARLMAQRLQELEVSPEAQVEWVASFAEKTR